MVKNLQTNAPGTSMNVVAHIDPEVSHALEDIICDQLARLHNTALKDKEGWFDMGVKTAIERVRLEFRLARGE